MKDCERLRPPEHVHAHHHRLDLPSGESKHRTTAGNNRRCCVCQGCTGGVGWGFFFKGREDPGIACKVQKPALPPASRCFIISFGGPWWAPIQGVIPRAQKQASPGLRIRPLDLHYPVYDEPQHFRVAEPAPDC